MEYNEKKKKKERKRGRGKKKRVEFLRVRAASYGDNRVEN